MRFRNRKFKVLRICEPFVLDFQCVTPQQQISLESKIQLSAASSASESCVHLNVFESVRGWMLNTLESLRMTKIHETFE